MLVVTVNWSPLAYRRGCVQSQPPSQALRFSHRRGECETRVTGDEPQGTMGRVQTAGERRLARCLLPAFLCAHIFIVWVRGRCRASTAYRKIKKVIEPCYHGKISSFVGMSHRSILFFSLWLWQVVFRLATPTN